MISNKYIRITRILLMFATTSLLFGQTAEELKRFMDTYDKLKVDQQANEVVKKGIESEKGPDDGPVRLIIDPGDMTKYYREKMNVIQKDLDQLNRLLIPADSIPPLRHFGYNYFSLRDSIQMIDNANISEEYILGYGDEVIISIWGQAEQYERAILERDGTVFINNAGLLYLGGKTQAQAKTYVYDRFAKVYATLKSKPAETYLEFSIGKIKNINVSIVGHVLYPGNYVVNPSMSVSNLLIMAGGINETGSLRNIYLRRENANIDTLDLYPIITGVGIETQPKIQEGDIVIIPARGKTISITGGVVVPAYFEAKINESLSALIQFAGLTGELSEKQVVISRPNGDNMFLLNNEFDTVGLTHQDSIIISKPLWSNKSISISVANRPMVKMPWVKKMTFSQITSFLSVDTENISHIELIRRSPIDKFYQPIQIDLAEKSKLEFQANDHLSIHLNEKYIPSKTVVVRGEVNSPGTYSLINERESLNSLLNRAGGLNATSNLHFVTIKRDTLTFGSKDGNLTLSPGDTVTANSRVGTVKIEGEVHHPGYFEWLANSGAKDYISLAGGLTAYGDKKHIVYITPYGEATRINSRSNITVLPGSVINISEKPLAEQNVKPDRFQQMSSLVTSLVSIAILANTAK